MMVAASSLLIVAYLAVGALLQLLLRDFRLDSASPASSSSPAFGFAAWAFRSWAMNAFSQAWGAILPLRWYMRCCSAGGARVAAA